LSARSSAGRVEALLVREDDDGRVGRDLDLLRPADVKLARARTRSFVASPARGSLTTVRQPSVEPSAHSASAMSVAPYTTSP
jgi:hypothetical protein